MPLPQGNGPDFLRLKIKALAGQTGLSTLFNDVLDRVEEGQAENEKTAAMLDRLLSDQQIVEYIEGRVAEGGE